MEGSGSVVARSILQGARNGSSAQDADYDNSLATLRYTELRRVNLQTSTSYPTALNPAKIRGRNVPLDILQKSEHIRK